MTTPGQESVPAVLDAIDVATAPRLCAYCDHPIPPGCVSDDFCCDGCERAWTARYYGARQLPCGKCDVPGPEPRRPGGEVTATDLTRLGWPAQPAPPVFGAAEILAAILTPAEAGEGPPYTHTLAGVVDDETGEIRGTLPVYTVTIIDEPYVPPDRVMVTLPVPPGARDVDVYIYGTMCGSIAPEWTYAGRVADRPTRQFGNSLRDQVCRAYQVQPWMIDPRAAGARRAHRAYARTRRARRSGRR